MNQKQEPESEHLKKIHWLKPSTRNFYREGRQLKNYSFFDWLHGYIYTRWPYLYIGIATGEHPLGKIIQPIWKAAIKLFKIDIYGNHNPEQVTFADTYHGKVVPLEAARQLVTINRPVEIHDLDQIIPFKKARDIVLKNPDHIVVLDCPCRVSRPNPCLPLDVCLIIGEPFAGFVLEHHTGRSRRISQKEAVQILTEEHERGHVHHAFFKDAMLGRFYAICNCCTCCCGAMQAWRSGVPMIESSGYIAQVDRSKCVVCGDCISICPFNAIQKINGSIEIDASICMGCGVCVSHCDRGAHHLERDTSKSEPLIIQELMNRTSAVIDEEN
jgi:ferredoxin